MNHQVGEGDTRKNIDDADTSLEINIFGVPDTMFSTSQFVPDIKEIVTNLHGTMTMTAGYFKACDISINKIVLSGLLYI